MSGGLKLDVSKLISSMDAYGKRVDIGLNMYSKAVAKDLENHAKINAPWTNRTGMARKTLNGKSLKLAPFKYEITLSHGVNYGIWLELAHEKKYAIIEPTIVRRKKNIMSGLYEITK